MKIGGATGTYRVRIRFKLFRDTGNSAGKIDIGLAKIEFQPEGGAGAMGYYDITEVATATINVTDYATATWHDIELFVHAASYTYASDSYLAATVNLSSVCSGADVYISDLYVDENYGAGPGLPQLTKSAAYTLKVEDNGRHIYISTGGVTIPNNADAAIDTEFLCVIINNSGSTQTISKGGSVTLNKPSTGSVASLTLAAWGWCELLKVGTDTWWARGDI